MTSSITVMSAIDSEGLTDLKSLTHVMRLPTVSRFALIASLLGGAAIVPVVLAGQASAQAGSRICGRAWGQTSGLKGPEWVYKIYEVDKEFDTFVCDIAKNGGGSGKDPTKSSSEGLKRNLIYKDWNEWAFGPLTCEGFTNTMRNFKFQEDGTSWSDPNDNADICNNMNKSADVGEMNAYWLLENGTTANEAWIFHG